MFGIFWDCDGTLMDTERSYALAWQKYLLSFGIKITNKEMNQFIGVDDRLVHSYFLKNVNLGNFENTMNELNKIIEVTLSSDLLFEDAKKVLEELDHKKYVSSCVSASPFSLLIKKLKKANIDKYFSFIIGGDMVSRNKPYPDIYLKAISELQTKKNLIIEDSPTGIAAGKSAGEFVVAIDRGIFTKDELKKADLITEELTLDLLISAFNTL